MVKLNCIHQKASLFNWNHETYNIKQQFIKSLTKTYIFKALFIFFSLSLSQIQFYFFYQILFFKNFLFSI